MQKEFYKTALEREQEVLDNITAFHEMYGYSPSYAQLAKLSGLSKSRIAQIIEALVLKQLVAKDGSKARTLHIICK